MVRINGRLKLLAWLCPLHTTLQQYIDEGGKWDNKRHEAAARIRRFRRIARPLLDLWLVRVWGAAAHCFRASSFLFHASHGLQCSCTLNLVLKASFSILHMSRYSSNSTLFYDSHTNQSQSVMCSSTSSNMLKI